MNLNQGTNGYADTLVVREIHSFKGMTLIWEEVSLEISLHFVIWDSRDGLELASTSDIGDFRINHFFKIRLRYSLKRTKHASYWFKFCNLIFNLFVADKTWGRAVCWRLYQGNEEFPLEWVNVSFSRLNGPEALSF